MDPCKNWFLMVFNPPPPLQLALFEPCCNQRMAWSSCPQKAGLGPTQTLAVWSESTGLGTGEIAMTPKLEKFRAVSCWRHLSSVHSTISPQAFHKHTTSAWYPEKTLIMTPNPTACQCLRSGLFSKESFHGVPKAQQSGLPPSSLFWVLTPLYKRHFFRKWSSLPSLFRGTGTCVRVALCG